MAYHRNVSCARCHPYAAHIYDAEFNGNVNFDAAVAKPGLGAAYCAEYYAACKDSLRVGGGSGGGVGKLGDVHTAEAWCLQFLIKDTAYQLPDVWTSDLLSSNVRVCARVRLLSACQPACRPACLSPMRTAWSRLAARTWQSGPVAAV